MIRQLHFTYPRFITTSIIGSIIGVAGVFFDQILKLIARSAPDTSFSIIGNAVRWEYFENTGIAFSIPLPQSVILIVTPLILLGLGTFFLYKFRDNASTTMGAILIIAGATSNFIDRLLYSVTFDYLAIFTSVINFADVMIVVGGLLLLTGTSHGEFKKKREY